MTSFLTKTLTIASLTDALEKPNHKIFDDIFADDSKQQSTASPSSSTAQAKAINYKQNTDRKKQYLQQLAAQATQGDAESLFELACYYDLGVEGHQSDDHTIENKIYNQVAINTSSHSDHESLNMNNHQKNINPTKAVELLSQAVSQNHIKATYNLALHYELGVGTSIDLKKAAELYEKAAIQGHTVAQYNLALCYALGEGTIQDWSLAMHWYKIAGQSGYARANYNLGVCYIQGKNTLSTSSSSSASSSSSSSHLVEGYQYILKAAHSHLPEAQYYVGVCLEKGQGVEKDPTQAIQWYYQAAQNLFSMAMYRIGVCCEYGIGTTQDLNLALDWYQTAAQASHAKAMFALGRWNEIGIGEVKCDLKLAYQWYDLAVDHGCEKAREALRRLRSHQVKEKMKLLLSVDEEEEEKSQQSNQSLRRQTVLVPQHIAVPPIAAVRRNSVQHKLKS